MLIEERRFSMAAMPNQVTRGGSNGLGGEVVAVHAPIHSKGSNVRSGETPRVWLSAGEKMALNEGLSCQALDLAAHGFRRQSVVYQVWPWCEAPPHQPPDVSRSGGAGGG